MPESIPSPNFAPHRRRWFRISLRGLMVFVVLVAVPVGWETNRLRGRRAALDALEAAGARNANRGNANVSRSWIARAHQAVEDRLTPWVVSRPTGPITGLGFIKPVTAEALALLPWFDELEDLNIADHPASVGAGWEPLGRLPRLKSLQLKGPGVTDKALAAVGQARALQELTIDRATATDAGFAALAGLPDLEDLRVTRSPALTDAGLARLLEGLPRLKNLAVCLPDAKSLTATARSLGRHHPALSTLDLSENPVDDADLVALAGIAGLSWLSLNQTRVTDAGLVHLRRLPKLESLDLASTAITDAGLDVVGAMPQIRYILLHSTAVTDAGLVHLARLPLLRYLDLSGTRVTGAGLTHLAHLPSLVILDLSNTLVTDAAMSAIARVNSLVKLDLREVPGLTDAGLVTLYGMGNLASLDLRKTGVTSAGVAALNQARPKLKVDR